MDDEYKQLLNRAARLCSSGEKCTHEIREKFVQWGMKETDIEKALDYLIENKFIDDARYAGQFVKDKFKFNKWGKIKITYALRQKRIAPELIEDAVEAIDPEAYNALLDTLVSEKIKSTGSIKKAANKAKVFRFVAQKGFSGEEIYNALDRWRVNENS